MVIGSVANAPTISHSDLCFANPNVEVGHTSGIALPVELPNALDSFA